MVDGVDWQRHEAEVQSWLGISSTVGSGNKFFDPSDGTDKKHYSEGDYQIMLDCKATFKKSYRLDFKFLKEWREKARLFGKTFLLPVRFVNPNDVEEYEDWVVMQFNDYTELHELARRPQKIEVVTKKRTSEIEDRLEFLTDLMKRHKTPEIKLKLIEIIEWIEKEYEEGS